MESLKNLLHSESIKTKYLNWEALYDYCGDDLNELMKHGSERSEEIEILFSKYEENPLIFSFFGYFFIIKTPHIAMFQREKFFELSSAVLCLRNREILREIFKYFLNEDVVFLNVDAIYDESESWFSTLIDSLRNDTCVINYDDGYYMPSIESFKQRIEIFEFSDLRTYILFWCYLFLSRTKSLKIRFCVRNILRVIDNESGTVHCFFGGKILGEIANDFF